MIFLGDRPRCSFCEDEAKWRISDKDLLTNERVAVFCCDRHVHQAKQEFDVVTPSFEWKRWNE